MSSYIYKITHPKSEKFYLGSSSGRARFSEHKSRYKRGLLAESSKVLFDLGIEECKFEKIEIFECESFEEQLKKEQEYFEKFKDQLVNINRPHLENKNQSNKDYYQKNKDRILKKQKEKDIKDRYNELEKERLKVHYFCSVCQKEVRHRRKARHEKGKLHQELLKNI